jgi:hypothetical protein
MTYRILKNRIRKLHLSFTIWFNTIIAPLLIAVEQNSSLWKSYFGEGGGVILTILIVGNALIRILKTNKDLADK